MFIDKVWTKRRPLAVVGGYIFLAILLISILYAVRFALRQPRTEKVIRILCFGDSLTKGSVRGRKNHPYSMRLQQLFDFHDRTLLGDSIRPIFEVHNAGIPGERAVDQMFPRLKQILLGARKKYGWVIILGGTNDLRKYREDISSIGDYGSIFRAVQKLHNVTHKYGARTVALTIPDRECMASGACYYLKTMQSKINDLLRDFAAQSTDNIVLADLASEIVRPRDEDLWSDHIHLNERGYDKMADFIYNSMKEHV